MAAKEAGLRTFGLASLLGCMGSLLGPGYALMGLGLLGLLVIFLNVQSLLARPGDGTDDLGGLARDWIHGVFF